MRLSVVSPALAVSPVLETLRLGAESSKKGDPSEVSDLRYLEDEETEEVDDLKSVRKRSK